MESTRHERIIAWRIREHDKLCTADGLTIPCELCRTLDDFAHLSYAVHIDASLRRTKIYRGTYEIRRGQRLRNRLDERAVARRIAFLHQRRKSADKIDADFLGCLVKRLCYRHIRVCFAGFCSNSNRRDRNAFMDDWDAILGFDVLTRLDQKLCRTCNFIVDVLAKLLDIRMCTITKGNPHRNSPYIQLVLRNHTVCF